MLQPIASLLTMGSGMNLLYLLIVVPLLLSLLCLILPRTQETLKGLLFLLSIFFNLVLSLGLFVAQDTTVLIPWAGFGMNLAIRVYAFSRFAILAAGCAFFLVGLYSLCFIKGKSYQGGFICFYLLLMSFANGVFLANNLVMLLFFWEAIMLVVFGMLLLIKRPKPRTAVKAIILNAIADFLLLLGIAITYSLSGSLMMDVISGLPVEGAGVVGFLCMMLGAVGKAGAVPFHSWIPDAADDAPLPFMAILPGVLEKLLGIYLLFRVCVDFYALQPGSVMSQLVMWIGALTLFFGIAMALIQNDIKRMLAFSAVGQVGYMVLGIGTALPVGIVGAVFHMLNHAMYKSSLFLAAGAVEKATGTTDLRKIGGLGRRMPITGCSFLLAGFAFVGFPGFNAFFSKDLIFDAALQTNVIFYIIALLGVFGTAASFLKVMHAAFFGPLRLPQGIQREEVREVPLCMLLPMFILAAGCLLFGLFNRLPLGVIQPLLGERLAGVEYAGWPHSMLLVLISIVCLLLAVGNHILAYRYTGSALKSVDHFRYIPGVRQFYDAAEKHYLDPYNLFLSLVKIYALVCSCFDRMINWIYDVLLVKMVSFLATNFHDFSDGSTNRYLVWTFSGLGFLAVLFLLLI